MKRLVIFALLLTIAFTVVPSCYASTAHKTDDREQAQMNGQDRAGLVRAIQLAKHYNYITGAEEKMLYFLIDNGYGYPEMLRDYIKEYKRKGRSMDDFIQDLYSGKLPQK